MKACKLYFDRKYIAERLGISEEQLVIGQVESSLTEVTITILVDDDAEVESTKVENERSIRRQRLDKCIK